eukprot:TRINITY_DN28320_c0_g1_i1.p1 TRINITY_DN28320_c0_g1~~TRINITY_DN28320_c0_g1_i1.p1  ORF type:complete len:313 (+),score=128.10 TRINITY_DN28320_c0_g1_i1:50-988(+)
MAAPVLTCPHAARQLLDKYNTFVFDCDGVIWSGADAIEGIGEAVGWLVAQGKKVFYVSNNSTKDRGMYVKKLRAVGIDGVKEEQVFNSGYATVCYLKQYLQQKGLVGKKVYCIGESGLKNELEKVCEVLSDPPGLAYKPEELAKAPLDPDVVAVVVGLDFGFNLHKLARGIHYLRYGEANSGHRPVWIMTNPDMSFPAGKRVLPGSGNILSAIGSNIGQAPHAVCGKPNPLLFNILSAEHADVTAATTLMVGDRLNTDIEFGRAAGLDTLMVLTGVNQVADIPDAAAKPTYVAQSVPDLVRLARRAEAEAKL